MWGHEPWTGAMWGFWWIFPVIGLLVCAFFVLAMVRMMSGGGHFMCRGSHHHDAEEIARLRREVDQLREQVKRQPEAAVPHHP